MRPAYGESLNRSVVNYSSTQIFYLIFTETLSARKKGVFHSGWFAMHILSKPEAGHVYSLSCCTSCWVLVPGGFPRHGCENKREHSHLLAALRRIFFLSASFSLKWKCVRKLVSGPLFYTCTARVHVLLLFTVWQFTTENDKMLLILSHWVVHLTCMLLKRAQIA